VGPVQSWGNHKDMSSAVEPATPARGWGVSCALREITRRKIQKGKWTKNSPKKRNSGWREERSKEAGLGGRKKSKRKREEEQGRPNKDPARGMGREMGRDQTMWGLRRWGKWGKKFDKENGIAVVEDNEDFGAAKRSLGRGE